MTRDDLRSCLTHPNVVAFLRVIREGESSQDDGAYRMMYGGGYFDSFADHPRKANTARGITSTAAGAYQILSRTWDGVDRQYGFEDFSPQSQDEAAVALIAGRKALNALLDGNLADVLDRCSWEWASLPPNRYGQGAMSAERVYATYDKYGGHYLPIDQGEIAQANTESTSTLSGPQTLVRSPAPSDTESPKMPAPLVFAAANLLLPFVADLFRGHGGKSGERNADIVEKAGPAIVEIAKTVAGVQTAEQAIERIQGDPEVASQFRRAVELDVDRLVGMIARVTEIDDTSRDRAAARAEKDRVDLAPGMATQQFWFVVGVAVAIATIAFIDVWQDGQMNEGVLAIVASVVAWALQKRGTIIDYRFGSSAGSAAKDEIIAASKGQR